MNELIKYENGEVKADSRMIADHFEKRHDNVMADVRDEIEKLGNDGLLIFQESSYLNQQNKFMPCYEMNEEGIMQLAARYDAVARRKLILKIKELKERSVPKSQAEMLLFYAQQFVDQERKLNQVTCQIETIKETIVTIPDDWRKDINKMLVSIGKATGDYGKPKRDSYELLTNRAGTNLQRKLDNLIGRLAKAGAKQSEIKSKCYLDVIEPDKRLKEIYTLIVKEMHIKYCA